MPDCQFTFHRFHFLVFEQRRPTLVSRRLQLQIPANPRFAHLRQRAWHASMLNPIVSQSLLSHAPKTRRVSHVPPCIKTVEPISSMRLGISEHNDLHPSREVVQNTESLISAWVSPARLLEPAQVDLQGRQLFVHDFEMPPQPRTISAIIAVAGNKICADRASRNNHNNPRRFLHYNPFTQYISIVQMSDKQNNREPSRTIQILCTHSDISTMSESRKLPPLFCDLAPGQERSVASLLCGQAAIDG